MVRSLHASSIFSAAAAVVLLTLGMAASVNTTFAGEPLTAGNCADQTQCPCPGACLDQINLCPGCICPNGRTCQ
jgi:hypothetical protein